MFIPEKMMQIQAVFSDHDVDAVADAVIRDGNLQMADAGEVESWAQELSKYGSDEETGAMRDRRERIERMCKDLSIESKFEDIESAHESWEALDPKTAEIEAQIKSLKTEKEAKLKELSRFENLKAKLGDLPNLGFALEGRDTYSYLCVEAGRIQDKNLVILNEKLQPMLHMLLPLGTVKGKTTVLVVALKRDRAALETALSEAGFEAIELGKGEYAISSEELRMLDSKIAALSHDIQTTDAKIRELGDQHGLFLRTVLFRLRKDKLTQRILRYFRKTDRTFLLSGWVPKVHQEAFVREIKEATGGRCVVKEIRPEELSSVCEGRVQVPVRLKNPAPIKPFELLTSAYGTPSYTSLDPTPLVGLSFLIMFGVMFGDVGHGLVLALIGALLLWKLKGEARNAGLIVIYAGCSSMLFGFLFGSIFGFEEALPTLWLKPMESISTLFKTLLFFGTGMLTVSVLLNIVSKLKKGHWPSAIFNKAGLMGLVVYWCGIVMAVQILSSGATAQSSIQKIAPILLAVAGVLLFFQEPITRLLQGKKKLYHEGAATGMMEGAMEMLEMFLGYLANTVSFIRVAAFGLAHVGLFVAVFALSEGMHNMAHGAVSVVIMIFGNIGIILLEGLVVTIQSVRLEFYEFFTRFFEHGDMPYRPVKQELRGV
jgi:V/A-type H+-transporting ATPase subunit I